MSREQVQAAAEQVREDVESLLHDRFHNGERQGRSASVDEIVDSLGLTPSRVRAALARLEERGIAYKMPRSANMGIGGLQAQRWRWQAS